jgi:hypothetical protein
MNDRVQYNTQTTELKNIAFNWRRYSVLQHHVDAQQYEMIGRCRLT